MHVLKSRYNVHVHVEYRRVLKEGLLCGCNWYSHESKLSSEGCISQKYCLEELWRR